MKNNNKFWFLLIALLCCSQVFSQEIEKIDSVDRTVYFINVFKKELEKDKKSFGYSQYSSYQISSKFSLKNEQIRNYLSKALISKKLTDSIFLDSSQVYLDDIKHNDPQTYKQLVDLVHPSKSIKHNFSPGKTYQLSNSSGDFHYYYYGVNGKWLMLKIKRELGEKILGRSINNTNANNKSLYVYLLLKEYKTFSF